jgi:cytochrome oxidase Cu insertion factor (SCO1/SenC/PrrC family)
MAAVTRARTRGQCPRWRIVAAGGAVAALALSACAGSPAGRGSAAGQLPAGQQRALAANPDVDPGTSLGASPAPDFRLTSQFGQPVSLSQFRGKVVILAFTDSECTTICPLTTVSMTEAKALLGRAGDRVQLLGIDANPEATSVSDVMSYSRAHGMVNQWQFLTGSKAQLADVWRAYHIYVQIQRDEIDHTPALYVIDTRGRLRTVYLTQMAYASIGQAAQVLARNAASLLPGHPALTSDSPLAHIPGTGPGSKVTLPGVRGGKVTFGPGRSRLVMFYATWVSETSDLASRLTGLNAYVRTARQQHLPPLAAVDEAATEPSPGAAASYLAGLPGPLRYPVALDTSGRLADGYRVQDQPWFALVSASGRIVWKHDGWLGVSALEAAVRRAG